MRYLSRYTLSHRETLRLRLKDAYRTHQFVYSLFPREDERPGRVLYVDKGFRLGVREILILSGAQPKLESYGRLAVKPVPDRFLGYRAYYFETVINPVKRKNASGQIESIRDREKIAEWFDDKAASWGFRPLQFQIGEVWADRFWKGDQEITLSRAKINGGFEVTDREAFKKSFRDGIGRGKGFGCGLLQLRVAR